MPVLEPPPSERDYIAPTVYKRDGIGIVSGYNYYGTVNEAIVKWKYLNNIQGGANIQPEGQVMFSGTSAQTLGINCDFYAMNSAGWRLTSYKDLRGMSSLPPIVFRFYTTAGVGPYYAIYDNKLFGLSATSIDSVSPEKLAALDSFYREVDLLKYEYNTLVGFLNSMAQRPLNAKEQQIFNEGLLLRQNLQAQIMTIKGIEIVFTDKGATVGIIPLLIIAIVAILAAAAAWTITEITAQQQKTKQINDTYQLNQWIANKKQELAQQVQAGTISPQDAAGVNSTLDNAAALGNKIAENASKDSPGLIGQLTSLVKWGVIGYVAIEGAKLIKAKRATT